MAESLVIPVERLNLDEEVAGPAVERQPRELYIPTLNLDLQESKFLRLELTLTSSDLLYQGIVSDITATADESITQHGKAGIQQE